MPETVKIQLDVTDLCLIRNVLSASIKETKITPIRHLINTDTHKVLEKINNVLTALDVKRGNSLIVD